MILLSLIAIVVNDVCGFDRKVAVEKRWNKPWGDRGDRKGGKHHSLSANKAL